MKNDPLTLFLHEKTAEAVEPYRWSTARPDIKSKDPGERAAAAMAAAPKSPKDLARGVKRALKGENAFPIPDPEKVEQQRQSIRDASIATIAGMSASWIGRNFIFPGFLDNVKQKVFHPDAVPAYMKRNPNNQPERLFGLFSVTKRERVPLDLDPSKYTIFQKAVAKGHRAVNAKMIEIGPTVQSFFDKHDLINKGVTANIYKGPISGSRKSGDRYEIPSRTIRLSNVGKAEWLHEAGHAADYTSGRIGRARAFAGPIVKNMAMMTLPMAYIAGDRIKDALPGTIDDKAIEFMQENAPAIMGATLAATNLYPEFKANLYAIKHVAKTEGRPAAMRMMRTLGPGFASHILGAVPTIVGLALARKYMREAREENASDIEKTSGIIETIMGMVVRPRVDDIAHIAKQIKHQSIDILKEPGTLRKIVSASREVGTSPEFVMGATAAALPATMGALYLYGTPAGREIRNAITPETHDADRIIGKHFRGKKRGPLPLANKEETWREQNPLLFAGLVAAGASLSAGVASKFMSDLWKVL